MKAFRIFKEKVQAKNPANLTQDDWKQIIDKLKDEPSIEYSVQDLFDDINSLHSVGREHIYEDFIIGIAQRISESDSKIQLFVRSFCRLYLGGEQQAILDNAIAYLLNKFQDNTEIRYIITNAIANQNPHLLIKVAVQNYDSLRGGDVLISRALSNMLQWGSDVGEVLKLIPRRIFQEVLAQNDLVTIAYDAINWQYNFDFVKNFFAIFDKLDIAQQKELGKQDGPRSRISIPSLLNNVYGFYYAYRTNRTYIPDEMSPDFIAQIQKFALDRFDKYLKIFNHHEKIAVTNLNIVLLFNKALENEHLSLISEILEIEPWFEIDGRQIEVNEEIVNSEYAGAIHVGSDFGARLYSPQVERFCRPSLENIFLSCGVPNYTQNAQAYYQNIFETVYRSTAQIIRSHPQLEVLTNNEKVRLIVMEARRVTAYVWQNKDNFRNARDLTIGLQNHSPELPVELEEKIIGEILPPYDRRIDLEEINFLTNAKKDAVRAVFQDLSDEIFASSKGILRELGHGSARNVREAVVESLKRVKEARPSAAVSSPQTTESAAVINRKEKVYNLS